MEKWRKERQIERQIEREIDRKKKEQESAEAISGLKIETGIHTNTIIIES